MKKSRPFTTETDGFKVGDLVQSPFDKEMQKTIQSFYNLVGTYSTYLCANFTDGTTNQLLGWRVVPVIEENTDEEEKSS